MSSPFQININFSCSYKVDLINKVYIYLKKMNILCQNRLMEFE